MGWIAEFYVQNSSALWQHPICIQLQREQTMQKITH